VTPFEIRPGNTNDIPRLMALDHSCLSDYVWQLELRREGGQAMASFREVRLPRSIQVQYPRSPASLKEEWIRRDVVLVAVNDGVPIGYICVTAEHTSAVAWVTDLVVSPNERRKGAGSMLLMAAQAWAMERGVRRLILETQSKNQAGIRLAQKFGYEFCGYNDQYYLTQDVALFFGKAIK
jgi:ribosomal protein S18 acetylase RimI-like enzyme